jgi:hypothetical protein
MLKSFLLGFASTAFIVLVTAVLTLDWFGGCGETFTFADGTQHQGECIGSDILKSQLERLLP